MLKARAAKSSMTLSDYLLSEIEQVEIEQAAKKPTIKEWLERVANCEPVELDEPPEATIRRMRDAADPRDAD